MNNNIQRTHPSNMKTRITYTDGKLDTKFQIKDPTKYQHVDDLIYCTKCPKPNCNENYFDETQRQRIESRANHCGKDKQSHLLKHAVISNHPVVDLKHL